MTPDLFLSDIRYSTWSNQRLLDAASGLSDEELQRNLEVSHNSVLATLRHFYDGERVWLDCLRDTPASGTYTLPPGPAPALSLESLKQHWVKLGEGYANWLAGVKSTTLEEQVIVQMPGSAPLLPRWKVLRHVLDHSQFHRGQVIAMIRALGHQPPAINRMDYWQEKE
jgi:uncharacterized damage-inducible protein DinB